MTGKLDGNALLRQHHEPRRLRTVPPGTRAFHCTPAENLPSILRDGIVPRIGSRSREAGEVEKAIFLFPDGETAVSGICSWLLDCFEEEPLALLAVQLPEGIRNRSNVAHEIIIVDSIPPESVEVLCLDIGAITEDDLARLVADQPGTDASPTPGF